MNAGPEAGAAVRAALGRISHRGPDGEGFEVTSLPGGTLLLGHRRLAIIDLSEAGLQPMVSPSGRFRITYNGEIYNYVELRRELEALGRSFRTHTDTEVLLQAWEQWGEDCLQRLDGMFAFALYDAEARELIGVRDPFGIKPFYYLADATAFRWASEIPALLEMAPSPQPVNPARIQAYLLWSGYDDDEDTFYRDIRQLRPGHLLRVDVSGNRLPAPRVQRYWWPDIDEARLSFDDAAERLRELFLQNVRRQLRSDVPIGINVSGGVDSSAIACAVRYLEPDLPIRTFSYDATEPRWSERKWAEMVIGHIGATAHWTDDREGDIAGEFDDIIRAQGEPFGSTSIAAGYRVFRLARENGVTVTLDGQGADELLGGYDGYPGAVLASHVDNGRLIAAGRYMARWQARPGRSWRMAAMLAGDAFVPAGLRKPALQLAGYGQTPDWMDVEGVTGGKAGVPSFSGMPRTAEGRGRRLAERLRHALSSNFLPSLLRHGDRNSMRWSIESRVPFLTPEFARFTLSLPEHFLVSPDGETKHLFRHAMRGIVPDAILDRQDKVGFQTPERELLARARDRVLPWLEGADAIPFLRQDALRREVTEALDGKRRYTARTWRILNLCRWAQLSHGRVAF